MGALSAPLDALLLRDQNGESAERNRTRVCTSALRLFACITCASTCWCQCAPRDGSRNALQKPSAFTCTCERGMQHAGGLHACARDAAVLPCSTCTRMPPTRHALASSSAAKLRDAPAAERSQPAPPHLAASLMSKTRYRVHVADGAERRKNLTPSGRSTHLAHPAATPDLRRSAPAGVATLDADVKQRGRTVCTRMRRAARSCSVQQSLAVRRHMRKRGRRTRHASAEQRGARTLAKLAGFRLHGV